MKIEQIDIYAQLRGAGINTDELKLEMADGESQYFQYHYFGGSQDGVETINVESTARSVMEEFTRMPVDYQQRIFYQLKILLKVPGDQIVVNGDQKKRGARIVRLSSDDENVHNLLLTH